MNDRKSVKLTLHV